MSDSDSNKDKALSAALSQIEKQFGEGAIMPLGGEGRRARDPLCFRRRLPRPSDHRRSSATVIYQHKNKAILCACGEYPVEAL